MPRVVPPTSSFIAEAARILQAGGVVAFPTETVYGLGALTLNEAGLDRVYELKGRPANNPLIAHVAGATIDEALLHDTSRRIAEIRASDEGKEGVAAFLEKRKPNWQ